MNAPSYADALAGYAALAAAEGPEIAPACRTLLLAHGRATPRATLFLHGLTASPGQFAALAAEVHGAGDNVLVVRLPRHGHADRLTTTLRDLAGAELIASVTGALAIVRGLGARVRIVGFSLGGLLAAWLGHHHDVAEIVAIAPFFGIVGLPGRHAAGLAHVLDRLPNAFVWWHPLQRERLMPVHGYPRYPTRALGAALHLAAQLQRAARAGPPRSPISLVINAGEASVSNAAIAAIAAAWRRHPGAVVHEHRLTGMPFSHDIIEPLRERPLTDRSYPLLRAILRARPLD